MRKTKAKMFPVPISGIHTICIIIDGFIPCKISKQAKECVSEETPLVDKGTGEIRTKFKLNANKWYGSNGWCNSYEEYERILWLILREIGVDSYSTVRVDFAFNYIENNYDDLHKLHKCICLLAAHTYKTINRYESTDPLILEHLTTRIQNEYIEIENYNKRIESSGKSRFANRLELRNKALNQKKTNFKGVDKLVDDWSRRYSSFITQYEEVLSDCNNFILDKWSAEQGTKVKDMSEFVRKYQDNIFSLEQLTSLYSKMGVKNPKGSVKNFRRYNEIEFVSKKDIATYFKIIDESLREYFSGSATKALKSDIDECA